MGWLSWILRGEEGEVERLSWRQGPASEAQLAYIRDLQEMSEYPLPLFTGKTRGEASDYIDKWHRLAHERVDDKADNYGDWT